MVNVLVRDELPPLDDSKCHAYVPGVSSASKNAPATCERLTFGTCLPLPLVMTNRYTPSLVQPNATRALPSLAGIVSPSFGEISSFAVFCARLRLMQASNCAWKVAFCAAL